MTDHYTYRIFWWPEDAQYIAICEEFGPQLSHAAETQEAALAGIRDLIQSVVADIQERGQPVPTPVPPQLVAA